MSVRTESAPPPGALKLHEAWKVFFERYWSSAPLPPRPDGLSLKVQDSGGRAIGAILWNSSSGRYFVCSYAESPPALAFPLSYAIKDSEEEIVRSDVIRVNFSSVATRASDLEYRVPVAHGTRLEFLTDGAPAGFSYSIRSGLDVRTTEQQEWENEKFDRSEEAGKLFADAFRNGDLEAFTCRNTASSERELDQLDPAAWGTEVVDEEDSTSSSASLARHCLLSQEKIMKNVLAYLHDLDGWTAYVWKSKFNEWLDQSPRHRSPPPPKAGTEEKIIESNQRLYGAIIILRITWPPKGRISTSAVAKKICGAVKKGEIERIGWEYRTIQDVLDGKHEPSNRLARMGKLPRWWSGDPWPGNLQKK
jgi:hypothetical protein